MRYCSTLRKSQTSPDTTYFLLLDSRAICIASSTTVINRIQVRDTIMKYQAKNRMP